MSNILCKTKDDIVQRQHKNCGTNIIINTHIFITVVISCLLHAILLEKSKFMYITFFGLKPQNIFNRPCFREEKLPGIGHFLRKIPFTK